MTPHVLPPAALDDRLGFIGTSGSGKTYAAGVQVERLLDEKARVVVVDPLDVWWGLRLKADGQSPSGYDLPIFGGARADLPLNVHAGALIGETVATMRESCIISLGGMATKSDERRFMLAFLDALYRKASGEPVHLIFDEADLWAPQKASEPKLQSLMEQIVRRGRIKGFIPWLITQRPAVLSKDVLSQVDGLVAMKLTASQDRDAIGGWIEGAADRVTGREILNSLPAMQQGHGVIWVPGRAILETVAFPAKRTFDSSRTPKRGEKRGATKPLAALDLDALKGKLATVEEETKANDPRHLKAEIARLKAEIAQAQGPSVSGPDAALIEQARQQGYEQGRRDEWSRAMREAGERHDRAIEALRQHLAAEMAGSEALAADRARKPATATAPAPAPQPQPPRPAPLPAQPRAAPQPNGALTGPQNQLLGAIAWWHAMGHAAPSKAQVAAIAGWRVTSGHIKNVAGSLRTKALIDYPSPGTMALTAEGRQVAPGPDTSANFHDRLRGTLTGPQAAVFDILLADNETLPRDELARRCGWEPTSGHVKNVLGSMRTLEVIDYPERGTVALQDWVNP